MARTPMARSLCQGCFELVLWPLRKSPITEDNNIFGIILGLVGLGWFGLNGPLGQYFSLYRAVSQREGERGEKG